MINNNKEKTMTTGTQDSLYPDAVKVTLRTQRASTSNLQRHLRIGYVRACRLMELLEKGGIVSAEAVNGSRKVLNQKPSTQQDTKQCSKRKCKWQGTQDQMAKEPMTECKGHTFVCPKCGNDSFYENFEPA